tara:strand:- start:1295 stop:1687 length:393 start_codon:yes stop_codon:yes gene_type:complete
MASFWTVLKKVGSVTATIAKNPLVQLIPGAAPFTTAINQIDGIYHKIQGDVVAVEASQPEDGNGAAKAAAVIGNFDEWFGQSAELANSALALRGERLVYDAAILKEAVDAAASYANICARLKASVQIVKV